MDIRFDRADNRISLARETAFRLADLTIDPATRQVRRGDASETLEPRVMQVLVALGRTPGSVIARDDLVDMCWDGRIVGDNAINRVISRLRSLATGFGAGAFEIETITKVGYRLTVSTDVAADADAAAAAIPPETPPETPLASAVAVPGRRAAIATIAAATVAATGIGAVLLLRPKAHVAPPLARELLAKGLAAQRESLPEATMQAIAFLEEATRIDPEYADAWGALALSYRHRLENDPTIDAARQADWVRSAADRALALDPGNADADVAKLLVLPMYRNWALLDGQYRAGLARHPNHWLLRGTFGLLMYNVGRWSAGIEAFARNVAREPFLPLSRYFLGYGLWHAGRLQEAEAIIKAGRARWPTHPALWFLHFNFLAHGGRGGEAGELLGRTSERPMSFDAAIIDRLATLARALGDRDPAAIAASIADGRAAANRNAASIPRVVPELMLLGRPDAAFALLDSYFTGTPRAAGMAPGVIGPLTRRQTDFLFTAATAPLRRDPRYPALLHGIGLDAYWRTTGTRRDSDRA